MPDSPADRPAVACPPPVELSFEHFLAQELRLLEARICSKHQAPPHQAPASFSDVHVGLKERTSLSDVHVGLEEWEEDRPLAKASIGPGPAISEQDRAEATEAECARSRRAPDDSLFSAGRPPCISTIHVQDRTEAAKTERGRASTESSHPAYPSTSSGRAASVGSIPEHERPEQVRIASNCVSTDSSYAGGLSASEGSRRTGPTRLSADSAVSSGRSRAPSGGRASARRGSREPTWTHMHCITPRNLGQSIKQRALFAGHRPGGRRGVLSGVVSSASFETACTLNILLNIFLIGYQTNYMASQLTIVVPSGLLLAESICCFLFILEVSLRMLANHRVFLWGPEQLLNNLDLALAIFQAVEVAVTAAITGHFFNGWVPFALFRAFRIARLIRLVRSVRLMKAFAEVRSIALSILISFRPLMGAFAILIFLMYVFAVIFVEMLLEDMITLPPESAERELFGSIMRTVHTLIMSVTGGLDWREASELLPYLGREVLFPFFVAWTTLGLFNIVTGAFVASTSLQLREDAAELLYNITKKYLQSYSDAKTNKISKAELHVALSSSPVLKQSLALSSNDIEKLFALFDTDEDDSLDVDDIMSKLRIVVSPARRLEQEILLRNTRDFATLGLCEGLMSRSTVTGSASFAPAAYVKSEAREALPLHEIHRPLDQAWPLHETLAEVEALPVRETLAEVEAETKELASMLSL